MTKEHNAIKSEKKKKTKNIYNISSFKVNIFFISEKVI